MTGYIQSSVVIIYIVNKNNEIKIAFLFYSSKGRILKINSLLKKGAFMQITIGYEGMLVRTQGYYKLIHNVPKVSVGKTYES